MVRADSINVPGQTIDRRTALRQGEEASSVMSLRQLNVNHTRNLNYKNRPHSSPCQAERQNRDKSICGFVFTPEIELY